MHAPSWICRKLYAMHPRLRLAWAGRPAQNADDLNAGSFAIVQLYHRKDCGSPDAPTSFREFWKASSREDPDGTNRAYRLERGPIFSKDGKTIEDWTDSFHPIYVANLKDFGVSNEDVLTGKVLETINRWLTPVTKRMREHAKERGREMDSKVESMSKEMQSYLIRESQKPDAPSVIMAPKHCKEDMQKFERKMERLNAEKFEETLQPPKAPNE